MVRAGLANGSPVRVVCPRGVVDADGGFVGALGCLPDTCSVEAGDGGVIAAPVTSVCTSRALPSCGAVHVRLVAP